MKSPPFAYHRPESVDAASDLLAELGDEAKVLAGGQSLLPMMALRLARPAHLVDVTAVSDLDSLELDADGWLNVGAGVRHSRVERSDVVATTVPLLSRAMPWVGHSAIRTRGTVCGSLAHADPAAELPAVALALGAEFVIRSPGGTRTVGAADFFAGTLQTALVDGDLLEAVRFPPAAPRTGCAVHELSRRHGDFAMIGAAGSVTLSDDGDIERVSIAYFGAAGTPVTVDEAEAALTGEEPGDELFAEAGALASSTLRPPADIHASRAYRAHCAGVLTRRVLHDACADAVGSEEG